MKRLLLFPFMTLMVSFPLIAGQLGVNIDLGERGGTFVDIVKEGYRWSAANGGDDLTASQVDSLGWPAVDCRYVLDYRPVAEWTESIDDPQAYRIDVSGTYKCAFSGKADVKAISGGSVKNASWDSSANTTTFDFVVAGPPAAGHGLLIIDFTNTKRTPQSPAGSGITRLRMNRPGYGLDATKTFTDEFIACLTGIKFSAIRFMDFSMTNGHDTTYPARTTWARRKHREDASQDRIPTIKKADGGAWEYVIELCNQVKMDPWINVPISADSAYIASLAKLFKDGLDQDRHVYVESSNEVWNTAQGFEQSLYSQDEAKDLGIGDQENHARRTVQIARIFSQAFGGRALNTKVRVILCSHKPMLKWWVSPMLSYIARTFGPPKNFIYAIACQTYFGGGVSAGISADKILSNCHDEIKKQIDETGKTDEAGRVQWIKLAKDSGLVGGFCSYEGGPDHGGGGTDNIANRITAERDPRMGSVWTYNIDTAFFQLGGNLAMQFTLTSAYTRYGCWGLTDDVAKPNRNSKYKAAQEVALRYSNGAVGPAAMYAPFGAKRLRAYGSKNALRIAYTLEKPGDALFTLWNLKGRRVLERRLPRQPAGEHVAVLRWSAGAAGVPGNNYLIATLTAGNRTETCGSMVLGK
jgi:hypothetical protein